MSALVGGKRSPAVFFEDEYYTPVVPAPKRMRIRCSAALHFSPPPPPPPPSAAAIKNLNDRLPSESDSNISNVGIEAAAAANLPSSGSEWVELIVTEMSSSLSMDDARARASRVLEELEKSIVARAQAESFHKEKEQVEKLLREGEIWKRGFKTLHRQKDEFERRAQELQQLKVVMEKLEMENYELKLRLVREQQSSPMPGRFHPEIFG